MENENEQAQNDVIEQEENTSEDIIDLDTVEDTEEETVSIPKSQFTKMKRKAIAYDSTSKPKIIKNDVEGSSKYNILEDDVADLIFEGYKKDEVKFILANGGRKALEDKDSYVSIAINAKREQKKTEDAVSQTSNKGVVNSGGKEYTLNQLNNMSAEELEKILPHA